MKTIACKSTALGMIFVMIFFGMPAAFAQAEHAVAPGPESLMGADLPVEQDTNRNHLLNELQKAEGDSLEDHRASIMNVSGSVKILKRGASEWIPAESGGLLEPGDQVLTAEDSFVEIAYDKHFLNIARIDSNTRAEFRSIEPTDLFLEDGTIFNALDGLSRGGNYQVSTPTAVAAVRGTHFNVDYDAAAGKMLVATVPVPEDNHESRIEVQPVGAGSEVSGGSVFIGEGNELTFGKGEVLLPEMVREIRPEMVEFARGIMQNLSQRIENFEELRRQGLETFQGFSEKHLEQQQVGEPDQDRKFINGPNDGGDGSGNDPMGNHPQGPHHPMAYPGQPEGEPPLSPEDLDHFVDDSMNNHTLMPPLAMEGVNPSPSGQEWMMAPLDPSGQSHPPSTMMPGMGFDPQHHPQQNFQGSMNPQFGSGMFPQGPAPNSMMPPMEGQGSVLPPPSGYQGPMTQPFDPNIPPPGDFLPPPPTYQPDPYQVLPPPPQPTPEFCQSHPGSQGC